MGGKFLIIAALISLFFLPASFSVDTGTVLSAGCDALCNAQDWEGAAKCYRKETDPPAAYLAVAACAFNMRQDAAAEEYALKSAASRHEWATFLNRFGHTFINTGGLGETYVLAHVASGGVRHESTARAYLRTSRQCRAAPDADVCVENYFNNVKARYQMRQVAGVRSSGYGAIGTKQISGRITDHYGLALKYVPVTYRCSDALEFNSSTDADGRYEIKFEDIKSTSDFCTDGRIIVKLNYVDPKDKKVYFRILTNGRESQFWRQLDIRSDADLVQDFALADGIRAPNYNFAVSISSLVDKAVIFTHTAQALEFYKDKLKANVDYKLPVDIATHVSLDTAYYPDDAFIAIKWEDSRYDDSDRPKNREYHEFGHHVMYSMYGRFPGLAGDRNHAGYINPSTGDSYVEGFAEFMALVIADHYGDAQKGIYPTDGNIDVNWKAWSRNGFQEEIAVAGVLWDLYDPKNDDKVQMNIAQIWIVLAPYSKDFTEVYEDLIAKNPTQKKAIDDIFKFHGFFQDKTEGNGVFDATEAFLDKNSDWTRDRDEPYTDYAQEAGLGKPWMVWSEGEKIGQATNYQRPARRNAVRVPAYYIAVEDDIDVVLVDVAFADDPGLDYSMKADVTDGKAYISVPPWDYAAEVRVSAQGSDKDLIIDNAEFEQRWAQSLEDGFYTRHDFGITPSGTRSSAGHEDEADEESHVLSMDAVSYSDWTGSAQDSDYVYHAPEADAFDPEIFRSAAAIASPGPGMSWVIPVLAVAIVLGIVVGGFFVWKSRAHTHKVKKHAKHKDK